MLSSFRQPSVGHRLKATRRSRLKPMKISGNFQLLANTSSIIYLMRLKVRTLSFAPKCRCDEFREPAQSFVYRGEVSRTRFTNREPGHE
ncbi:hypothetical protein MESS2_410035 [Mesorhizobium metallidurans STM 2683]|uniref:Uncharacterized protein n=1 Tax=Mesorhizobium metallidurans STM 2683 TaxID=1297569 RepID=M5ERG6_9HYPH|nr:hypothetical protein MESS2_410035 [Mesorhizobium metallidurans STM 2683]